MFETAIDLVEEKQPPTLDLHPETAVSLHCLGSSICLLAKHAQSPVCLEMFIWPAGRTGVSFDPQVIEICEQIEIMIIPAVEV